MAHDLIFFEKRSTPKVVSRGQKFTAPESYGKQTRRRPATADEEKKIAKGDVWLRVDQSGKKGGEPGYKKTRMKGREHLVKHDEDGEASLSHYGVKGMRWGVTTKDGGGGGSTGGKPKEASKEELAKALHEEFTKADPAKLQAEGQAKLKQQAANGDFPNKQAKRDAKASDFREAADAAGKAADAARKELDATPGGIKTVFKRGMLKDEIKISEAQKEALLREATRAETGKLSSKQRQAIALGAGLAVTGLALYGSYKLGEAYENRQLVITEGFGAQKAKESKYSSDQHYEASKTYLAKTQQEWRSLFGEDHEFTASTSVEDYGGGSFYVGLTSKKALQRPEFTIPADTTFQRLSNHKEDSSEYGTKKGAYATFLSNDKKIYGGSWEFGGKAHTVSFQAKGPTRVPSLPTVLAHLKQVKQQETGEPFTEKQVMQVYHGMAGGGWSDKTSVSLMNSLKQFGYGAIVDDMDAGYLGDLPIVFFGDAKPATITDRPPGQREEDAHGTHRIGRRYA